jgi:hypothetical protein
MYGKEETIMQQQYTMMNMIAGALFLIGGMAMFGVGALMGAMSKLGMALQSLKASTDA